MTNWAPNGGRLHTLTLKVDKSRYGLGEEIIYNYASGKMTKTEDKQAPKKRTEEQLTNLLRTRPGMSQEEFEKLAGGEQILRNDVREFLRLGLAVGQIRCRESSKKRGGRYYLPEENMSFLADHAVV